MNNNDNDNDNDNINININTNTNTNTNINTNNNNNNNNKNNPSTSSSIPQSLLRRLEGLSSNKAGLIRDPDQVARIIYQSSKGSKYFLNERAKDLRLTHQIDRLRIKLEHQLNSRNGNLTHEEHQARRWFENLDRTRVVDQSIVCIDADAFFCSVEEMQDPSLKGKAFAVGSGVLTTASYEARKWGCRSAMAGYIATKLCPHLIFVEPDFTKYQAASKSIMDILRHYDPNLSPASLDECYLNITSYCHEHNLSPDEVTRRMREHVLNDIGLTVSAGIGPNAMIAKIAADLNKPNGQFECPPTREGAMNFMKDLPVRKVPGIGRVTERWLEVMGVKTCGDIWDQKAKLLLMRSEVGFELLIRAYLGLGETDIKPTQREDRQSVGCESSFKSISKPEDYLQRLKDLSQELAADLSRLKFAGRTLTLKIKLDTFEVLTRSITPTNLGQSLLSTAEDLYKQAKILLEREIDNRHSSFDRGKRVVGCGGARELSIRLLGIKVSQLQDLNQPNQGGESSLQKWISSSITTSTKRTEIVDPAVVDPEKDGGKWRCPICNRKMPSGDLAGLNEHVDLCLWQTSEEARQDSESIEEEGSHDQPIVRSKKRRIESADRPMTTPKIQNSSLAAQGRHDRAAVKPGGRPTTQKNVRVKSILDWCGKERRGDQD